MNASDPADYTATAILVIKADENLTQAFLRILGPGPKTPAGRIDSLIKVLEKAKAPAELKNFVRLLKDEKLASELLKAISE